MRTAVDLTDLAGFENGFPHHVFAELRRESPVAWHAPTEHTPGGVGFWSVTSYADAVLVGSDPLRYSSMAEPGQDGGGTLIEDLPVEHSRSNKHSGVRRLPVRLTPRRI